MSYLRIGVLISAIFMLFMNTIGSAFIGTPVGQLSDAYQTRVVAAGYAFAIWGVIFIGTAVYAFYQLSSNAPSQEWLDQIAPYAIFAFIMTAIWIPAFQLELFAGSLVIMLLLLGSLAAIYGLITQHQTEVGLTTAELWIIKAPFSVFLGWITAATILNFSQTLSALGWNGFGISDVTWGVIILCIAGLIAGLTAYWGQANFFYAGTVVWALTAVAINQSDARPVATTAIVVCVVVLLAACLHYILPASQTIPSFLANNEP